MYLVGSMIILSEVIISLPTLYISPEIFILVFTTLNILSCGYTFLNLETEMAMVASCFAN